MDSKARQKSLDTMADELISFLEQIGYSPNSIKKYQTHIEKIRHFESRSILHVIFGKTCRGWFACIPDFWVACYLTDLQDAFRNTEKLIAVLGVVNGITVATALDLLKNKFNV